MLVVRLVETRDIDALYTLASTANPPLTNLPAWRETLASRVQATQEAIRSPVEKPGAEAYMFALEDTTQQRVVGTATLRAWAGMDQAYYTYRRETLIHASPGLGIRREVNTLALSHEISEASQLCAMALAPEYQQDVTAHVLLRKARLAFMRLNPERFSDQCVVAFTGEVDDSGESPFWNSVGQHFFGRDYHDIHALAGRESKSFIAEMMPQLPLYEELLTTDARAVIGHTHQRHLAHYNAMLAEGFHAGRHVDIFDAGPVLQAATYQLKTLKQARFCLLEPLSPESSNDSASFEHNAYREQVLDASSELGKPPRMALIASGTLNDFRAVLSPFDDGEVPGVCHVDRLTFDILGRPADSEVLVSGCDASCLGKEPQGGVSPCPKTGYRSLAHRLSEGATP